LDVGDQSSLNASVHHPEKQEDTFLLLHVLFVSAAEMACLGGNYPTATPECQTRRISGRARGGSHAVRVSFLGADNVENLQRISVLVRRSTWENHYVSSA